MVKFVAKTIAVDNSDLSVLDGYKPFGSSTAATIGVQSKYKNGDLSLKVTQDDTFWFKISQIETTKKKANKLFEGDWEPKVFSGNDKIKGSTEADALYGFAGNDVIKGNDGDDTIYGGAGKDKLYGGGGGDTMFGGKGNDFLDGGEGVNYLTGGAGKDTFAFSAALGGGNYSQIEDFQKGKDKIQLSKSAFDGIGKKGTLKEGKFFLIDDYDGSKKSVIYDPSSGNMSYTKDGVVDPLDAQVFGRIANGAELSHKDFLIA